MNQLTPPVNAKDHFSGNGQAAIELVEYGDYECPYCGRAYPIVKDIQERLGAELNLVFRNFPLRKIHAHAFQAAMATEAAARQGKFWEMHDVVFENQQTLEEPNLYHFAAELELNLEQFREDMEDGELMNKVENDFESGMRSGVNRTPSFFINGAKFEGDWSNGELLGTLMSIRNGIVANENAR